MPGSTNNSMAKSSEIPPLQFATSISIGHNKLQVAVANTNESRQQGLSGQASLGDGQGMLFDFKNSPRQKPGFWMKGMLFPLDIIWVRGNTVVDITPDVPLPSSGTSLGDLPLYFPAEPIDTVVEVPAEWCQQHGISVGAKLEYKQLKP